MGSLGNKPCIIDFQDNAVKLIKQMKICLHNSEDKLFQRNLFSHILSKILQLEQQFSTNRRAFLSGSH